VGKIAVQNAVVVSSRMSSIYTRAVRSLCFVASGLLLVFPIMLSSCSPFTTDPRPGPDKQAEGTFVGALTGAGAGAVIGTQYAISTGPGVWIGAGFGAVFGMLSGLGIDLIEEDELRREFEQQRLREIAWVQEVLSEHYARRMELHPSRDIYPADWFFESDSSKLREEAKLLTREIAYLSRRRMPWSRIVIASYITSSDPNSSYGAHISKSRANAIALQFVRSGVEPRRVLTKAMTLAEPILVDPDDNPGRYRQAIEIITIDY
jgi:outer membrane protein OmpA-like peptidoglycan-associated protein